MYTPYLYNCNADQPTTELDAVCYNTTEDDKFYAKLMKLHNMRVARKAYSVGAISTQMLALIMYIPCRYLQGGCHYSICREV